MSENSLILIRIKLTAGINSSFVQHRQGEEGEQNLLNKWVSAITMWIILIAWNEFHRYHFTRFSCSTSLLPAKHYSFTKMSFPLSWSWFILSLHRTEEKYCISSRKSIKFYQRQLSFFFIFSHESSVSFSNVIGDIRDSTQQSVHRLTTEESIPFRRYSIKSFDWTNFSSKYQRVCISCRISGKVFKQNEREKKIKVESVTSSSFKHKLKRKSQ